MIDEVATLALAPRPRVIAGVIGIVAALALATRAGFVAGMATGRWRFFVPTPRVFDFASRRLVDPSEDKFLSALAIVLEMGIAEGGGVDRARRGSPPLVRGGHRVHVLGQERAAPDAAHVVRPRGRGRFAASVAADLRQLHGEDMQRAGVAEPNDGPLYARAARPPEDSGRPHRLRRVA